jgi:hypothetical protein
MFSICCILAFALHHGPKGSASASALQVQVHVQVCALRVYVNFTGEPIAVFPQTGELLPKFLIWQQPLIFQHNTGEPIAKFPTGIMSHSDLHFCTGLGARTNTSIGWQVNASLFSDHTQVCISGLDLACRDNHELHGMVQAFARCACCTFPYHAGCGSAAVRVVVAGLGQGWAPCTNQTMVRVTCGFNCASTPGAVTGTTAPLQVDDRSMFSPLTTIQSFNDDYSVLLSFQSGGAVRTSVPSTQHNPYPTGSLTLEESSRVPAPSQERLPIDPFVATPGSGGKELERSLTAGVRIEGPSPGSVPEPGWVSSPHAVPLTHSRMCSHVTSYSIQQRASLFIPHLNDQVIVLLLVVALLLASLLLWLNSPDAADVCTCMHECIEPSTEVDISASAQTTITACNMCMILCVRYGRWVKGTKHVGEIPRRSAKERAEQHWAVGMDACNWCRKEHVDHDTASHAHKHVMTRRRVMLLLSFASFVVSLLIVHFHVASCSSIFALGITPVSGCTSVTAFHHFHEWLAGTMVGPYFNPLPQGVHNILPQTRHYDDLGAACDAATLQVQHQPPLSRSLALMLGDYPPNRVVRERVANPNSNELGLLGTLAFISVRALGAEHISAHAHGARLLSDLSALWASAAGTERLPRHMRFLGLVRMATPDTSHIHTGWMWFAVLVINVIFSFPRLPLLSTMFRETSLSKQQCYVAIVRELVVSLVVGAGLFLMPSSVVDSAESGILSHISSRPAFCVVAFLLGLFSECVIASICTAWLRLEGLCYLSLAARFKHLEDVADGHCVGDCASHECKCAHAHASDGSCCAAQSGRDTDQCQGGLETHSPVNPPAESIPVHEGTQECGGTAGREVGQQGHDCVCTSGCACVQSSSNDRDYRRAYKLLALLFSVTALYLVATEPGLLWDATFIQCIHWVNMYCPVFTVIGSFIGRLLIAVTGEYSALVVVIVLYYNLRNRAPAIPAHIIFLNADYSRQEVVRKYSDWIPHTICLFTVSVLQQLLQRYPEQVTWLLQEACYFGFWNTASCVLVAVMLALCPFIVHCIEVVNRVPQYIVATVDFEDGDPDDDEDEPDSDIPSCVVMTGVQATQGATHKRQENWAGDYPLITAQGGIALLRQLDAFRRACLQQHCKRPQEESVYVMALRDSCPDPSNLHTLLRDRRPELGGKTAVEFALKMADDNFVVWRGKVASGEIKTGRPDHMADVLEDFYPSYVPPPGLVQAIAELEAEKAAEDTVHLALRDVERELQRLGNNLVEEKLRHDTRTPMQKYAWMLAHPEHNHLCKQIKALVELARSQERDRQDALGGKMVAMQASQFREIDDFKALNWLQEYILAKLATISASNVTLFKKMKMLPGETPRQAHAKAYREAELIKSAKVTGFIIPVAIYELLTNEKQEDGGTFFPKALVDITKGTITTLEITREIPEDDHEARTRIMIDVMDRQWKDICTSPDGELSVAIRRQLQVAKALDDKNQAAFLSHELPHALPKADGRPSPAPASNPAPAGGGKFECSWHGVNDTHDTARCKQVARAVSQAKAAQAKATAERESKAQAATTATVQRENISDGGIRPGSGIDRQIQREAATPASDGMIVCDFCSKIAKRTIKHKPGCFLKGERKPYEGWTPIDDLLLAYYNSKRAEQGLPPLAAKTPAAVGVLNLVETPDEATEPAPGTVIKRTKVRFSDEVVTAAVVEDRPATYIVATLTPDLDSEQAAIRLSLAIQGDDAMDRFTFHEPSRTFTCRSCSSIGTTEVSSGLLLSVGCANCRTKFMYNALPQEWRRLALWLQDPSILSASIRERLGMYGDPVTIASPATRTDSSISFARVGSEPYTPHRADNANVSHAETMQYLASARIHPNFGGSLSTMNSSALAVILGEYGSTGKSSYAHRVKAILNELPEQTRTLHEDRITKAVARYNASKTAKDMVAASSYAQVLKADPPLSSGEERLLRSSRLDVAIDPVTQATPGSQVKSEPVVQVSQSPTALPVAAGGISPSIDGGRARAAADVAHQESGAQRHVPTVRFTDNQPAQQPVQLGCSSNQPVAASMPAACEISDQFGENPPTTAAMDPRLLRLLAAPAHNLDTTHRLTCLEACIGRWLCQLDGDKEARCSRIERLSKFCHEQFELIASRLAKLGLSSTASGLNEFPAAEVIKRLEELESIAQEYDIGSISASGELATRDLHPLKTWRATAEGPLSRLLDQDLDTRLAAAEQGLAAQVSKLTLSHPDQHLVKQQIWKLIGPSVVAYIDSSLTPDQRQTAMDQPGRLTLLQSLVDRVDQLEGQTPVLDLAQALDEPTGELLQQVMLRLRPALGEFVEVSAEGRMASATESIRATNQRLDELDAKVTSLSDNSTAHIRTRVDNEVELVRAGMRQQINEQVRNTAANIQARVLSSTTELVDSRVAAAGKTLLASALSSTTRLVHEKVQQAADDVQATIRREVELQLQAQRVSLKSDLRLELLATIDQEVHKQVNAAAVSQQQSNQQAISTAVEAEVRVRMNAVHAQMDQVVHGRVTEAVSELRTSLQHTLDAAVANALAQQMAPYGHAINQLHDGMVQLAQQASATQQLGQLPQQIARMAQELGQQREAIGFTMGAVRASHQVVQEQLRNLSPSPSGYATPEEGSPNLPTPTQLMFESAEPTAEHEEGYGADQMDESSVEAGPTLPQQEGPLVLQLGAIGGTDGLTQLSTYPVLAHPLSLPSSRATSRVVTPVDRPLARAPTPLRLQSDQVPLPEDDLPMQESSPLGLAEMRQLLQSSAVVPLVDSPDDSVPAQPATRPPTRIEFSGERQSPLNPAWLRQTQPQDQISSPQDIMRLSPARGEGETRTTQAAPVRRLEFHDSVPVSPERSPREITRFVAAAHVIGSTAIDDSCTDAERAELAAWAEQFAEDQPPPLATVAQVSSSSKPTDAAVRDGLLQAAAQLTEDAAALPAVPQEGTMKQSKRAAKRGKDKRPSKVDSSWPHIHPGLQPTATDDTIRRFVSGCYLATGDEVDQHEAFFRRRPTLVWLEQKQPSTSLNLYTEDDLTFLTPPRVMLDSGADVVAIISQKLANAMQLTWTKGSVNLRGVGGTSASDGTTHQKVRIRLGGCADEHSTPSAYEGCLSVLCHPVVCSPEFTQAIKADVILGQGFIRPCLGVMDLETERFSYAPAYMKHACKDFRVSVPCLMSVPKPLSLQPSKPPPAPGHTAGVVMVQHADVAAAYPELEDMCDGPVSVVTVQAAKASKADTAVAKLSPGFHAQGVPSREEHERSLKAAAERNAADRREAEAIRAAQMSLVAGLAPKTLKPIGYVYSAEQIDRLNRSQPGGLLDISGPTANEMVETERVARRVRAEYSEEFNGRIRTMEAALADVSKKLTQLQSERTAQPPSTPAPTPPAVSATPSQPAAEVQQVTPPASTDVEASSSAQPVAADQPGVQTRAQRNRAGNSGAAVGVIARPVQRVSLSRLPREPTVPVATTAAPAMQADGAMPQLDVQDDYA